MMAAFSLNVSAIAQDTETPDYYVIAQSAQENTITNGGKDGSGREWWGYDAFNRDIPFSLDGCNADDIYIDFDLYVESPLAKDGLAFAGIEWGCPMDDGKGKSENQNYINITLKSAAGNWTYADMSPAKNTAFGDIFGSVRNGEWNHISLPLSQSPNLSKLDMSAAFKGFSLQFARMKSGSYVFKLKNFEIVDHGKVLENEVIPASYTGAPTNTFTLGTKTDEVESNFYITLNYDHVDLSKYSDVSFNFVADVTPGEGETEKPELLTVITQTPAANMAHFASLAANEVGDWGKNSAMYDNLKNLDWQFGSHVYTIPMSALRNADVVNWADLQTVRMYLYCKVYKIGTLNVKFTDFYFTHQVVKDAEGGDDVTGIEEGVLGADSHVVIYNLSGVQVFSGVYGEAQLPAGLYVVVGANGSRKVMF